VNSFLPMLCGPPRSVPHARGSNFPPPAGMVAFEALGARHGDAPSGKPGSARAAALFLPAAEPSFESAYLAALAVASAGPLAATRRSVVRVRRCSKLPAGSACLFVGDGLAQTEGNLEHDIALWQGAKHATLPEILAVGHKVFNDPNYGSSEDGSFCMELAQRIRSANDDPALLGHAVGALTAHLVDAGIGGSSRGERSCSFLGGVTPSLLSDVPLAGALLTSKSWCIRVKKTRLAALEALEGLLKGRDLVMYWLLSVLSEGAGLQALRACRGEADALEALCTSNGCDGDDDIEAIDLPEDVVAYLGSARPPCACVAAVELQTDAQRAELARREAVLERARRPLIEAVRNEDLDAVRSLLRSRVDVGARMKSKHHEFSLEHVAASLGVSVPAGTVEESHPAALISDDLGIRLHAQGTSTNRTIAADMLKTLLEARASLNTVDSDGSTPVFYAAMAGNVTCLEYILEEGGPKLFAKRDNLKRTALYWATSNDQYAVVEWLVSRVGSEFDIDAQSKHGRTALAKAAWSDLPEVASVLIKYRADPLVKDDHGRNVLHMASWGQFGGRRGSKFVSGRVAGASPRCVEMLLKLPEGVECLSVPDRDDATPMHIAASTGALDVLQIMLSTEAGKNCLRNPPEGARDFVPLAGSAFRGHVDCLMMLLEASADARRRSNLGRSALDFAVAGRQVDTAKALIEHIASGRPRDDQETTNIFASAAEWACRFGASGILGMLLEAWPPCARARDLVRLCLLDVPDEDVAAALPCWPPFPEMVPDVPSAPIPEHSALLKPFGPLFRSRSSSAGFPAASTCCIALLQARAAVDDGTICSALREGLLENSKGAPLRDLLVDSYLQDRKDADQPLTWPLIAAANAGDHGAVAHLLARKADPAARRSLALAIAAASGSASVAAELVQALLDGGRDAMCALDVGKTPSQPAVLAAGHGHAACTAKLLGIAGGLAPFGAAALRQACARAAAAGRHLDMARWLEEGDPETMPNTSALAASRAASTVLHFRISESPKFVPATRARSRSPSPSSAANGASTTAASAGDASQEAWEALAASGADSANGLLRGRGDPLADCIWAETASEASAALALLFQDLTDCKGVALLGVDLECFHEAVCTVQLSSHRRDVVLDALRLHDVLGGALRPLLADPGVLKVFHAPRGDLRWLWSNFGLLVVGLFDTAAAARELDRGQANEPSLKSLCREHLGVEVDKTYQRADWRLRPLPRDMLSYASGDSRVLLPLATRLAARLAKVGRLEACREACRRQLNSASAGSSGISRLRVELL